MGIAISMSDLGVTEGKLRSLSLENGAKNAALLVPLMPLLQFGRKRCATPKFCNARGVVVSKLLKPKARGVGVSKLLKPKARGVAPSKLLKPKALGVAVSKLLKLTRRPQNGEK